MTDDDLTEIEARADKATPGPWGQRRNQRTPDVTAPSPVAGECLVARTNLQDDDANDQEWADSAFIAAARTDVPRLVAEVRRLRQALDDRRAMHANTIDGCRTALAGYARREDELTAERDQLRAEVERLCAAGASLEGLTESSPRELLAERDQLRKERDAAIAERNQLRAEVERLRESGGFWGRSLARESLKLKAQEQEVQRLRGIVMAACDRQAREMDAEGYAPRCSCGLHGKDTP